MNLEKAVKKASQVLKNHNILSYELDAQIILSNIMGIKREFLIVNDKIDVSEKITKKYEAAIRRRARREPVAYITGKKEFWSKDYTVTSATLVPRPETELLIYKIVNYYKNKNINILDIGTGSGCILLSILGELSRSRGIGIDISSSAIKIAYTNAKKLKLTNRSKFKVSDINKFNLGKYDLIMSNPPYIPKREIRNLSWDIANYEPHTALNGGIDGLDLIKKIIYKSTVLLKKNGLLAIEIGNRQYLKASYILKRYGFKEVSREYDYNRNVRCIISTKL